MTAVLDKQTRRKLEHVVVEARWRAYQKDPIRFFEECVWVPSERPGENRVLLKLYDYQRDTMELWDKHRFVIVLKARQLGLTTISMARALHMLLFRPGTNILLVSKDQATADRALELLDFMWDFLPQWVKERAPKQETKAAREHTWKFPDGMKSRIVSRPATKTAGAGETATLVMWDEAALAEFQEDALRTLLPTTSAGGQMIVFSTARGGHNTFARLYREAQRGESMFVPMFHPWFVSRLMNKRAENLKHCPTKPCMACVDTTDYEATKQVFSSEPWKFFAEYPESEEQAFAQSGRTRFAGLPPSSEFEGFEWWRGRIELAGPDRYDLVADEEGPLRLREDWLDGPPSWANVVLSVDPATGVGGDYTAMTLGFIDQDGTPQRVGFWHSNVIEPIDAARQADLLGRWARGRHARGALLVVEKQGGYGDTFINEFANHLSYPNLYVHRLTGHRSRRMDVTYGFPMNGARRPLVVDKLAEWVPSKDDPARATIEGIDPLLRAELGAFVVTEQGRPQADVGMHDDLVLSAAIWLWVALERGGMAGPSAPHPEPDEQQRFTLQGMFDDIDKAIKLKDRQNRRAHRAIRRSARHR